MGRMSERALETEQDDHECALAEMEEMFVSQTIVETAEICAADSSMFELFMREVYKRINPHKEN